MTTTSYLFESRSHLIEELFSVATRKTLKVFLENLNDDLDERDHVDVNASIREISRSLMKVSLEKLETNFRVTFLDEEDTQDEESEEEEDDDEEDEEEEENESNEGVTLRLGNGK